MTDKVLRVAAFTQGRDVPSARFRVRQYLPSLLEQGVGVEEFAAGEGSYPPAGLAARLAWLPRALNERRRALAAAQGRAQVSWVQREMVSTLATFEHRWRGGRVFDVDDAIWLHQRWRGADRIARASHRVVCGNAYLAEHFGRFAPTVIVPTAVDVARYVPGVRSATPLLCWSGSASGLPYLNALAPALARVLAAIPQARLRVISNAPPSLAGVPAERIEFVPWSPQVEVGALQDAWAGLMPMPDTPWTRGKCSYKMLTYMACGVAAVVSPYGMNADVLTQGAGALGARDHEWADVLIGLLRTPEELDARGSAGRATVLAHYAVDVLARRLADVFKEVATQV
ncbi:MAG: glycosyltransferase family 4 protein [Rhodocyclaceae bacterium]